MCSAEVLQGSRRMEILSTSECPAVSGSNDVRDPVRDDIKLDGQWKYKRLCEGTS